MEQELKKREDIIRLKGGMKKHLKKLAANYKEIIEASWGRYRQRRTARYSSKGF